MNSLVTEGMDACYMHREGQLKSSLTNVKTFLACLSMGNSVDVLCSTGYFFSTTKHPAHLLPVSGHFEPVIKPTNADALDTQLV